jgi:hypothetical protein
MRIDVSSVICGWRLAAAAAPGNGRFSLLAGPSARSAAGAFLFLWIGGASGSRGFLGRRVFFATSVVVELGPPSTATLGFRPGFLRGRPAAVNGTAGGAGGMGCPGKMPNRAAEPGSTTISSISMFARPWLRNLVGDPGSESADGGDDNDVGDELRLVRTSMIGKVEAGRMASLLMCLDSGKEKESTNDNWSSKV